ncbi:Sodium/hydrogen exchanger 2 [Camellia lanceoleosa]|uniref:Sodium/hydrogen exchanger 2 n=1 Tax=Camellia lanceoleosa TaxID=1840588 RepID=A0ACC0IN08_9ERIC|nr:Sodium/hydrogen exchanger 2 [Camellia lanceoleosa]
MSGKELSKLVAFVKGTPFDIVQEYLQRERHESAHLENFASGLELIGQKAVEAVCWFHPMIQCWNRQITSIIIPRLFLAGIPIAALTFLLIIGAMRFFNKMNIGSLDVGDYLAIGAIFSATDSVCTLQVLNQDETPLLYSLVFGEGVVNDATSVVLFNAIQSFDLSHINSRTILQKLNITAEVRAVFLILRYERHSTDREVALMMLMAYLSYMLAEEGISTWT